MHIDMSILTDLILSGTVESVNDGRGSRPPRVT